METSPPPPNLDLWTEFYYHLIPTLIRLLPPPLDDTPEALRTRNHAAVAKVAALLPVNADETDLAAQCIAARAQAEDLLHLLRQHAGDIGLVMRLNAQYGSMVRTSLSVHARLMRVQAVRRKREAIDGATNADAWVQHVAERGMLVVVNSAAVAPKPASPGKAPTKWPGDAPTKSPEEAPTKAPTMSPEATPTKSQPTKQPGATRVEAPAASVDPRIDGYVSEDGTDSRDAAFETWLSEQPGTGVPRGPGETDLRKVVRESMVKSRLANRELPGRDMPANSHENSASADHGRHIDAGTASIRNGGRSASR